MGGVAPDLDLLIRSASDPLLSLVYHRQFTHALTFIPAGGLLVGLFLLLFPRFRRTPFIIILASIVGYATHGLLDACTSYGTVLFWPFSNQRVAWDVISIIDPFFTLPLLWGVIWTQVFDTRKGVMLGLLVALWVLLMNTVQHHRAYGEVEAYAKKQDITLTQIRVFPGLASSTHWRAASFEGNKLLLMGVSTPLFSEPKVAQPKAFPLFTKDKLPLWIRSNPSLVKDFEIFDWFTDGYLIEAKYKPLIIVDGRYLINNPLRAFWGIKFVPGKTHVSKVRNIILEDQGVDE